MLLADSGLDRAVRSAGKLVLSTSEIDLAHQHLERGLSAHDVVYADAASRLDFSHHVVDFPEISIHRIRYGAPVKVSVAPLENFYFLQIALSGSCRVQWGRDCVAMDEGQMIVINPAIPLIKQWSPGSCQLTIKIHRRALQRQLAARLGDACFRPIAFDAVPVDAARYPTLLRMIALLCDDAAGAGLAQQHVSVGGALTEALLSILLHSLPHDRRGEFEKPVSPAAPFYVRRAEDYIRANLRREIGLADIATAAGVSARALNKGFRSFRETTPLAYLRAARLSLAREMLGRPAPGSTVTMIATNCGITHLGRFANEYARQFGERPSDTFKRSRR